MSGKPHILLAEDEPSLALLIKENLEKHHYEVTLCEDGDKTLKTFYDLQPALIVLDIMMPKLNGFDVAKTIRNTDRATPILFLTAKINHYGLEVP